MNEVVVAMPIREHRPILVPANYSLHPPERMRLIPVVLGHENVVHAIADERSCIVEQVRDAGVIVMQLEDKVVFEKHHGTVVWELEPHKQVLARRIDIGDWCTK